MVSKLIKQTIKVLLIVAIFAQFYGLFSPVVRADAVDPNAQICQNLVDPSNPPSICQKSTKKDPVTGKDGIVTVIGQTIVYITGIVSVVMIVIGGIKYITSAGDSNGTASAKNTILYALIGLVIAVSAQVIVTFVISKL